MLKLRLYLIILIGIISIASCGTLKHEPYNPNNLAESELVTITLDGGSQISKIDGHDILIFSGFNIEHAFSLPEGEHTLWIYYFENLGNRGTRSTNSLPITHYFEKGKTYFISAKEKNNSVKFDITEVAPKN